MDVGSPYVGVLWQFDTDGRCPIAENASRLVSAYSWGMRPINLRECV
jgi:hypothetical protein